MSCRNSNFVKNEHSGALNFTSLLGNTLEEVLTNIEAMLKDSSFSTSLDSSEFPDDPGAYETSVNELIDTIIEKLELKDDLPFTLSKRTKGKIEQYFKEVLLPKELTPVELEIQLVINGTDLISEEERRGKRLKTILREIYQDNDAINAFRQTQFVEEMRTRTIIDTMNRIIVDDQDTFNRAIIKYLMGQFKIIRDYLLLRGFKSSSMPQSLYKSGNLILENEEEIDSVTKIPRLVSTYNNVLQMMYNDIHDRKVKDTLDSDLMNGWMNAIKLTKDGKNEALFYNAVNAYVNLVYFDDVLEEGFGDFIGINENYDAPITVEDNKLIYKYSFEKVKANGANNWDEDHDSLKEMSKFQLVLIKGIPIYEDYKRSGSAGYGRMEPKDFVGSFSRILDVGARVPLNELTADFINAIKTFKSNTVVNAETILNMLFNKNYKENYSPTTLISSLEDLGVDRNILNYLYSVYRTVFNGPNSWKAIEDEYAREKGYVSTRYFIILTLLGVMDSNVAMNYALTTFNHDSKEYETKIKSRFTTNRTKFDIINSVNATTIDRLNKQEILNRYKISTPNKGKTYLITLNNFGTPLTLNIVTKDNSGLLDKKQTFAKLEIKGLPDLDKINLSSSSVRDKLISKENLTSEELSLMTILEFVDSMLGTYFSRDTDGLIEFNIYKGMGKNGLKELVGSASTALLVTDIYNQFENAKKADEGKYSKTELFEFLNDKEVYAKKILTYNDQDKKEYFIKRYDGYQLNTIRGLLNWIENLAKARAILSGDTSKSVISNLEGKKMPNFSPGFLGANIMQLLKRSADLKLASSSLLFVSKLEAIKAKTINTDVVTKDGLKKQIKNMTNGELLYDAIVNKFIVPFLNNRSIYTLPTTFSDKTKFLLYEVSLSDLKLDSIFDLNFNRNVEAKILDTIGLAYKKVLERVKEDYKRIFPEFVNTVTGEVTLDLVLRWFKTHKENLFIAKANLAKVTVYRDVHYRLIANKALSVNELLFEYAENLYTPEGLHARLEREKINFINDLLANRLNFEVDIDNNGDLNLTSSNLVNQILKELGADKAKKWIQGNRLVLGKVRHKNGATTNILYGNVNLQPGLTFELNPILNAFFMLDDLIGNNLRYSLTGSEINHKIKALAKLNLNSVKNGILNVHKEFIKKYNHNYDMGLITFYDLFVALKNYKLRGEESDLNSYKTVQLIYNDQIYKMENAGLNAQYKRNVIIPGTMRYYLLNTLNGIAKLMKVAVIDDMSAKVFNFDGKSDKVDAHDGAALVNPLASILENWSLQDCEVGTVKKPIQHWYDDRYMSATLLKYAVDTITNQWMRQAEGNDPDNAAHGVILRNLFKKMTNIRWHNPDGSWKFGEIDLISGCDYRNSFDIDFENNILEGKPLYYRDGVDHMLICDFGIENGVYYTIEREVNNVEDPISPEQKWYHYFTDSGEHVKSLTLREDRHLHTIDSLFELHTAMGGIYSESVDENGELLYSEVSNFVVARFINNVAILKPELRKQVDNGTLKKEDIALTQDNYYQPLKEAMIDVAANNSAVKNGAGNVNPTSSFFDDAELRYMIIGTEGYGIQMDADHTMDEAHMTEFSQVISSLDAGGRMHGYVSLIYETLGKVALELAEVELDAIKDFRATGNMSKVYEVVGRTIMNNLSKNKGQAGLANAIISAILELFNLNVDHAMDEFKIPFSDPNVYSTILATFVSVINKKSIKRQYPGSGTVMVPGYNLSMIYELNGKTYLFEDLIKKASLAGFTSQYTDLSLKNRDIVLQFLQAELAKLPIIPNNSETFLPTDNITIRCVGSRFQTLALDSNVVEWEVIDKKWKKREDKGHLNPDGTVKTNKALNIYLKGLKELGYFLLVKDNEAGNYSVHFKTNNGRYGDPDILPSTPEQRAVLYQLLYNAIPEGALVSTWGEVSPGGRDALIKLMNEGLEGRNIVKTRPVRMKETLEPFDIPVFQKIGTGTKLYRSEQIVNVSLDGIEDYYKFKDNIQAFLADKGIFDAVDVSYQKNIMVPRNLAPARIQWSYKIGEEIHTMNIFDHWRIKGLFLKLAEIERRKNNKEITKDKAIELEKEAREYFNPQQAFDELAEHKYVAAEGALAIKVFHLDENGNEIEGVINLAAELIISNLYKSKFRIKNGDSLADVLEKGPSYFAKPVTPVMSDSYDLVYTKNDNKNVYITFKPIQSNDDNFDSSKRSWANLIKKEFTYPKGYKGEKIILNRIYTATKDNIPLFEVGREILRNDVLYDKKIKRFVGTEGKYKGKVLRNQSRFSRLGEDKVTERIYFITNNQVTETRDNKTSKYTLYNINTEVLRKLMVKGDYTEQLLTETDPHTKEDYKITPDLKFDKEVNDFISHLLGDIYHTKDFNGIQVNREVTVPSGEIIRLTLNELSNLLSYDPDLRDYLRRVRKIVNKGSVVNGKVSYKYKGRGDKDGLYNALSDYHDKLSRKLYISFLKAQEFTASRIPAQTLQSFMLMRCVGFTGTKTNQCMVSHWLTWLQGSDYDIDKAYIMGLSFDGNGKYVGWSNLFDYSSLEALKASEYLPQPKGKVYKITNNGFNIDKYTDRIINAVNAAERIKVYAELLNYLNDNDITDISYASNEKLEAMQQKIDLELKLMKGKVNVDRYLSDSSYRKNIDNTWSNLLHSLPTLVQLLGMVKVVQAIMNHEFTKVPYSLKEDANKNFISSHILNTVLNLRNMIGAYSPIEMEAFREASESSPKGELASKMTSLNPATKLLMLYQNITGKNVIGIAANGEKASFMWHYYVNDILNEINPVFTTERFLRSLDKEIEALNKGFLIKVDVGKYITDSNYKEETDKFFKDDLAKLPTLTKLNEVSKKLKYALFTFTSSRIKGRSTGNIETSEINTLPDVNFENIDDQLRALFGYQLKGNITVDLMISLILSAATDNAKELILAKVNAGSKLAKVHLFLVTLGFNINDIVKFMTSPAVTVIDALTEVNIFTGLDMKIDEAIKLLEGKYDKLCLKYLSTRTLSLLNNSDLTKLKKGELIKNPFDLNVDSFEYSEVENLLTTIGEVLYLLKLAIDDAVKAELANKTGKTEAQIREEITNGIKDDINEFKNVLEGADEFSTFGKILGVNLGLATSKVDLLDMVLSIQSILSNRIDAYNKTAAEGEEIENIPLDVKRYLNDVEYAKAIRDLYESIKKCINIFDAIDHIPQFKAIFEIFSMILDIDHNIAVKSRAYTKVYNKLKDDGYKYIPEDYQKRLLKGIDYSIIANFVGLSKIKIPYKGGTKIMNELRLEVDTVAESFIEFGSLADIASFKYYFESEVVPRLKLGYILKKRTEPITGEDGTVSKWYYKYDESIASNKFIQSLIKGYQGEMPLYKCDLDMLTIENSLNSRVKFLEYIRGLLALKDKNINGTKLSDLFVLYNLVVNLNLYGSDRFTTLFDSLILNNQELSLIKDYLKWLGDMDYIKVIKEVDADGNEKTRIVDHVNDLNINILDVMRSAAAIVNSEIGLKDPTIIVNTENGPELRIKVGGRYVKWTELIPIVPDETVDEYLKRIHNHYSYFTLGGSYSDAVDNMVNNIRNMNTSALDTINNLIRQGTLTIYKVCR